MDVVLLELVATGVICMMLLWYLQTFMFARTAPPMVHLISNASKVGDLGVVDAVDIKVVQGDIRSELVYASL